MPRRVLARIIGSVRLIDLLGVFSVLGASIFLPKVPYGILSRDDIVARIVGFFFASAFSCIKPPAAVWLTPPTKAEFLSLCISCFCRYLPLQPFGVFARRLSHE